MPWISDEAAAYIIRMGGLFLYCLMFYFLVPSRNAGSYFMCIFSATVWEYFLGMCIDEVQKKAKNSPLTQPPK